MKCCLPTVPAPPRYSRSTSSRYAAFSGPNTPMSQGWSLWEVCDGIRQRIRLFSKQYCMTSSTLLWPYFILRLACGALIFLRTSPAAYFIFTWFLNFFRAHLDLSWDYPTSLQIFFSRTLTLLCPNFFSYTLSSTLPCLKIFFSCALRTTLLIFFWHASAILSCFSLPAVP